MTGNDKATIHLALDLEEVNRQSGYVPDYVLLELSRKYNTHIELVRAIRDVVQKRSLDKKGLG